MPGLGKSGTSRIRDLRLCMERIGYCTAFAAVPTAPSSSLPTATQESKAHQSQPHESQCGRLGGSFDAHAVDDRTIIIEACGGKRDDGRRTERGELITKSVEGLSGV